MDAHINEDELKLLAYLHEHANGYNDIHCFEPEKLKSALEFSDNDFRKISSYLAGFGLIGIKELAFEDDSSRGSFILGVWLTSTGENFMREIEASPSVKKKVTVKVVKEGGAAILTVAVGVLTGMAKHHLGMP